MAGKIPSKYTISICRIPSNQTNFFSFSGLQFDVEHPGGRSAAPSALHRIRKTRFGRLGRNAIPKVAGFNNEQFYLFLHFVFLKVVM